MDKACNLWLPVLAVADGTGAQGPTLTATPAPACFFGDLVDLPFAQTRAAEPDGLLTGLPAVVSRRTRLLLLGSFPGVASLQAQQYYGHARNQFWPILSALWGVDLPALPYALRLDLLRERGLGLWDVYARCRRPGSLDSAITEAQLNPLAALAATLPALAAIAHNGAESARAMKLTAALGLPVYRLPSTSPAHARWSFERKRAAWAAVLGAHGMMPTL